MKAFLVIVLSIFLVDLVLSAMIVGGIQWYVGCIQQVVGEIQGVV